MHGSIAPHVCRYNDPTIATFQLAFGLSDMHDVSDEVLMLMCAPVRAHVWYTIPVRRCTTCLGSRWSPPCSPSCLSSASPSDHSRTPFASPFPSPSLCPGKVFLTATRIHVPRNEYVLKTFGCQSSLRPRELLQVLRRWRDCVREPHIPLGQLLHCKHACNLLAGASPHVLTGYRPLCGLRRVPHLSSSGVPIQVRAITTCHVFQCNFDPFIYFNTSFAED